jgi:acetyltransferase-like isoleucine patch superfamily enzyme
MMRMVGPVLGKIKVGRWLDWWRFTKAKLRSPGTIVASSIPHIDAPFKLHMTPGATLVIGNNVHFRSGFRADIVANSVLTIGNDIAFNRDCWIGVSSSITIEDSCIFGPFVTFTDGNHRFDDADTPIHQQGLELRPLVIGRNVWIGAKATIIHNVGANAVIGANAVVTKPIPDNAIAMGIPARVVRYRDGTKPNA